MFRFEWDDEKAKRNYRKHKVSFVTAARVFDDPFALTELNETLSDEVRWETLGLVGGLLLLLVIHTDRQVWSGEETIHIISARQANPREARRYGQNRHL